MLKEVNMLTLARAGTIGRSQVCSILATVGVQGLGTASPYRGPNPGVLNGPPGGRGNGWAVLPGWFFFCGAVVSHLLLLPVSSTLLERSSAPPLDPPLR